MNPSEYADWCRSVAAELPRQRWSETDPSKGVGIVGAVHLGGGRYADLDFGSDVLTRDVVLTGLNEMERVSSMLSCALSELDSLAEAGSQPAAEALGRIEAVMRGRC